MILGVLYSFLGVWVGRLGPWATCRDAWASLTHQERAWGVRLGFRYAHSMLLF